MLIVREVTTAKPGQAGKLAQMFRRAFTNETLKWRVLTDLVGPYNTVIVEFEMENLAQFEQSMNDMRAGKGPKLDPGVEEEMKNYHDMYLTGRREIWRVVE
jgi:hypothetical protein